MRVDTHSHPQSHLTRLTTGKQEKQIGLAETLRISCVEMWLMGFKQNTYITSSYSTQFWDNCTFILLFYILIVIILTMCFKEIVTITKFAEASFFFPLVARNWFISFDIILAGLASETFFSYLRFTGSVKRNQEERKLSSKELTQSFVHQCPLGVRVEHRYARTRRLNWRYVVPRFAF